VSKGVEPRGSHLVSILLLLGLALLWGYNWVVMKVGIHDSGPVLFAAVRMLGGAAILSVVVLVLRRPLHMIEPWTVAAIGLFQTTGAQGMIAMALHGGTAGKSAVLNYTLPIWVMLIGFVFLGERPRTGQWIATATALVGVVIMTFVGSHTSSYEPILYAIGASICWGAGVVVNQGFLRRHPGKIDTLVLTTWQMIIGGILLGVLAAVVPEAPMQWNTALILAVLYNVGPATAVAFLLWFTLQRRIEANTLSLIVLIVPLVGIASGWLQLGEQPSATDGIGMALILAGIAVMVLTQRRKAPAPIAVPADN
jgi:drug/metabolite transporter (DMT)-like permease